jgi:hypothetical protein
MNLLPRLTVLALVCFGLVPVAHAVSPAPDGGYPGQNTAEGGDALFSLTAGIGNTAIGYHALYSNTEGTNNTATGVEALKENTTGSANTASGLRALLKNTSGSDNTAMGLEALLNNTTGIHNTANGYATLVSNAEGQGNMANGSNALHSNTHGHFNTADGTEALFSNTAGKQNIALGYRAGKNLTTGDNNINIGNEGVAAEANTIRIGTVGTQTNTYMAGIHRTTVAKGVAVIIDSTGHLGTKGSSERLKDAIKPMDKASDAILALKPVTFRYKQELDPEGISQFGLMAEDVAKVNPDLVVRDANGEIYTVRYDAVNAMLLNEFLKEHRKNEEQEMTIMRLQKQVEALTAGLQKVSAQVEASKSALQIVLKDQ